MMQNKLSRVGEWECGGGAGLCENMANSAQFQVKLPTGAELVNFPPIPHAYPPVGGDDFPSGDIMKVY